MGNSAQRRVNVGIMSGNEVNFELIGDYLLDNDILSGRFKASLCNDMLVISNSDSIIINKPCNGPGAFFLANSDSCHIALSDVTIGVGFHWEQKETQLFGGNLHLIVRDGVIIVINNIGIEDYLTSVISSEMSATASFELLKTHAVISRSWLLYQIDHKKVGNQEQSGMKETDNEIIRWEDREDHLHFDVCADDHCQRYQGVTKIVSENVRKAIEATWGEVLTYNSNVIDARFSKCCGGISEEFRYCWEDKDVPYLQSVKDNAGGEDFCSTSNPTILSQILPSFDRKTTDFYRWSRHYSIEELSELVKKRSGIDFGTILDLIPLERGVSGRIWKLQIVGTKKRLTIGKELLIRKWLSESHLYSSAFDVEKSGDGFTLHGKGWGHGVGLCQIGAAVMGELGYSYRDILFHYYKNVKIEKYDIK